MSMTCINEKGELAIDGTLAVPYKLEKGDPKDRFSSKILHTDYTFSLDLTPHGDVAILHTSHGGDFKVRILPVQGDFLVKPINLQQGLFGYKGGKADLEADIAKFERGKRVDSIDGMELNTLNKALRKYAINKGAYMDNSDMTIDDEYKILKESPDFAYGKDCTEVWEDYFKNSYTAIVEKGNFRAGLKLAQADEQAPEEYTDGMLKPCNGQRTCLYEIIKDKVYAIANEPPYRHKLEFFAFPGTRAEAEKKFQTLTSGMHLISDEERIRMLPYCRMLATERQKEIERVMAMPKEKRNGPERFIALLGEGMQKDPRSYGEHAVKEAQKKLGWTMGSCKAGLNMYAPDSPLAAVSRTFPYPEVVFNKLNFNKARHSQKER